MYSICLMCIFLFYSSMSGTVVNKIHEIIITPEVGITFELEDDAYDMYNTYAGKVGFNIKKSIIKYDKSLFKKYIVLWQ
jgi:hypothetical protein